MNKNGVAYKTSTKLKEVDIKLGSKSGLKGA